jgi:hypothetical protein
MIIGIVFSGLILSQSVQASGEVFVLTEDGGEHAPYSCQKEARTPKKLSSTQEMAKSKGYLGSIQIEFSDKNEAGIDAWSHYFKSATECESALKVINAKYSD